MRRKNIFFPLKFGLCGHSMMYQDVSSELLSHFYFCLQLLSSLSCPQVIQTLVATECKAEIHFSLVELKNNSKRIFENTNVHGRLFLKSENQFWVNSGCGGRILLLCRVFVLFTLPRRCPNVLSMLSARNVLQLLKSSIFLLVDSIKQRLRHFIRSHLCIFSVPPSLNQNWVTRQWPSANEALHKKGSEWRDKCT